MTENKPSDDFTDRIKALVADAKRNTQWRKQYMEWEREKTYIREYALEEGMQQKAVENAKTMLSDHLPTDKVALYSGLSLEQVLELQKELAAQPAPAN